MLNVLFGIAVWRIPSSLFPKKHFNDLQKTFLRNRFCCCPRQHLKPILVLKNQLQLSRSNICFQFLKVRISVFKFRFQFQKIKILVIKILPEFPQIKLSVINFQLQFPKISSQKCIFVPLGLQLCNEQPGCKRHLRISFQSTFEVSVIPSDSDSGRKVTTDL